MEVLVLLMIEDVCIELLFPSMLILLIKISVFVIHIVAVTDKGEYTIFVFLALAYFTERNGLQLGPFCCQW